MLKDANDRLEDQRQLITNLRSQIEQLRESELRTTREMKAHMKVGLRLKGQGQGQGQGRA